jgi:hypothetical protein
VGLIRRKILYFTIKIYNIKNRTGIIIGFVLGLTGCLLMFKVFFLVNIPPEDELAPGIVVIIAILYGLLFAFAGHLIQNYLGKKRT